MKSAAKCAMWLLPLFLAGCFHVPFHKNPPPPALILAPPFLPTQTIELVSIELPLSLQLIPGRPLYNMRVYDETTQPPARHRKSLPPEVVPIPEVAANPASGVSAIGQLTSGEPVSYRQDTEQSIASIEHGVSSLNRNLSSSERNTADQIREYLKQAKAALASGDVDGAHTLAAKAQVLLNELMK